LLSNALSSEAKQRISSRIGWIQEDDGFLNTALQSSMLLWWTIVSGLAKCKGWTMKALSSNTEDVLKTIWLKGGSVWVVVVVWSSDTTCSEAVVSKAVCEGEFGWCWIFETMIAVHSSEAIYCVGNGCCWEFETITIRTISRSICWIGLGWYAGSSPCKCCDKLTKIDDELFVVWGGLDKVDEVPDLPEAPYAALLALSWLSMMWFW